MRRIFIAALFLITLGSARSVLAAELPEELTKDLRLHVLSLINETRTAEGLAPLKLHHGLEEVAQAHSDDSAAHFNPLDTESREKSYLAHTSSDGRTLDARLRDSDIEAGWEFAENAGYWIRGPFGETEDAVRFGIRMIHMGMAAEVPPNDGHRQTLLGNFTHVGIGLSLLNDPGNDLNALFFVTDFARYGERDAGEEAGLLRAEVLPSKRKRSVRQFPLQELPTHGGPFLDVTLKDEHSEAITAMKNRGIIVGYPDGTFQKERTVSRGEILKMLLQAIGISPIGREFSACFTDVFNQWFAPYACVAKREGWITGYPDGSFQAEKPVTRAEGVTMAARIFGFPLIPSAPAHFDDAPQDAWFSLPLQTMASNDLLPFSPRLFHPTHGLMRGEVAEIVYRAMEQRTQE